MHQRDITLPDGIDATVSSWAVSTERSYADALRADLRGGRNHWRDMDPKHREALVSLIRSALTEMAQNPEAWLEPALVAGPDQSIGISMLFRLGNLDTHILYLREAEQAEQQARIAELEEIASGAS